MLRRIDFYALEPDIVGVLNEIESKRAIKYTLDEYSGTPRAQEWFRAADIPELGQASGEQSIICRSFFVSDWDSEIRFHRFQLFTGETRYSLDQILNPDTVLINPAGKWKSDIIISGSVATISDSVPAQSLMRLFSRIIRKHFTKVKAYWVGPEAMIGFRSGYRLTIAEQSPPEFNLQE